MGLKERKGIQQVDLDSGIRVLPALQAPPDLQDLFITETELEDPRTTPGGTP